MCMSMETSTITSHRGTFLKILIFSLFQTIEQMLIFPNAADYM
jgi:hypothetical protein